MVGVFTKQHIFIYAQLNVYILDNAIVRYDDAIVVSISEYTS